MQPDEPRPVSASNSHAVIIAEVFKLRAELAEATRKGKDLCKQNGDLMTNVLRDGRAWSLLCVLEELEWVANAALDDQDSDRPGYKKTQQAIAASKEIRAALATPTRAQEWDSVMDRAHNPVLCAKCGQKIGIAAVLGVKFCPKCCKEAKP